MKINKPLLLVLIVTLVIAGIYLACPHKITCPFKSEPKKYKLYSFQEYLDKYETIDPNSMYAKYVKYAKRNENGCVYIKFHSSGTNVLYRLNEREVSKDILFQRLNKYHKLSYPSHPFRVLIYASEETPVGLIHDLHEEVKKTGINDVDCIISGRHRNNKQFQFSTADEYDILMTEPPCS